MKALLSLTNKEKNKLIELYNDLKRYNNNIEFYDEEGYSEEKINEQVEKYNEVSKEIGELLAKTENAEEIHEMFMKNDIDTKSPKYKYLSFKNMNKSQFKSAMHKIMLDFTVDKYRRNGNILYFLDKNDFDSLSQKEKIDYLNKRLGLYIRFEELFRNYNEELKKYESFFKKIDVNFKEELKHANKEVKEVFIDEQIKPIEESLKNGYKYPDFPKGTYYGFDSLNAFFVKIPFNDFKYRNDEKVKEYLPEDLYKLTEQFVNNLKEIIKQINRQRLPQTITKQLKEERKQFEERMKNSDSWKYY